MTAVLAVPARAEPPCARTIHELRALVGDAAFPLRWRETTMVDGKPLELTIAERGKALFLSIVKGDEGTWVEGAGTVCRAGEGLSLRFAPGTMSIGPSAHWAVRFALSADPDFTLRRLGPAAMRLGTLGWSGDFSAP